MVTKRVDESSFERGRLFVFSIKIRKQKRKMKKRFVVQMLRTSRCLNGVSSNAVRKCRSVPRRAHRQKVSTRPASLSRRTSGVTNEQIIGSPVDVDISPLACQQGFKTDTEYKQGVQSILF